jgi:hypothetical protein
MSADGGVGPLPRLFPNVQGFQGHHTQLNCPEQTLESLGREFLLNLSTGFVDDVLRDRVEQLDF